MCKKVGLDGRREALRGGYVTSQPATQGAQVSTLTTFVEILVNVSSYSLLLCFAIPARAGNSYEEINVSFKKKRTFVETRLFKIIYGST